MTPSLKNYKKTGLHYKKNVSASKKESCSKRSSSSKKRGRKSELKKNESKSYYTQNSLNISKLLRRDKHKSPSILLTKGKPKVRHIPKSVVNNPDDNESLITANNSYIHNLNISPEGFSYSTDYINSHTDDFKSISNSNKAIEVTLEKK